MNIADLVKTKGFRTGIFGKWHLGLTEEYHAMNRGFDEFYGFMGGGAHPYFDHSDMEYIAVEEEALTLKNQNKQEAMFWSM